MDDLAPDHAEFERADEFDDAVPARGYQMLPVVGLGGSAGSLAPMQSFFSAMPVDSGLAFVVVVHLSPEHDSTLAELLQRATSMPVIRIEDTHRVEPNTVYVIPPGKSLQTMNGYLRLADAARDGARHVAVDLFFRTLADTHGPHATAVVLSGMDGDGAIGLKRIKERGGLTIVQDPDEAQYSGMPRAAMATGMVDWVLPVIEMPARVIEYHRLEGQVQLPPESGPQIASNSPIHVADEVSLRDVLTFLRTRTGRDFTWYKRATVLRRIGRRMQVNGIQDLSAYLNCLRTRPGEAGALQQDLLITVTNFFRDSECFDGLKEQVQRVFRDKGLSDPLRIWVVACATGEEAYSVAILLSEHARTMEVPPPQIQIFASDLDATAVAVAREGLYPFTIEADVSAERLKRFFIKEHRGYRVRREIREMILFAVHDVLKDSPFSRLDLVTCRNLLIYLNRDAQKRALETFQFALRPGGLLFLGASESVEDDDHMFSALSKRHRLYTQRATPRSLPVPIDHRTSTLGLDAPHHARGGPITLGEAFNSTAGLGRPGVNLDGRAASWSELHFKLLEHMAPPSILVDPDHNIVHLSSNAGRFLHYSGGEPSRNLMRAIHPSLRIELRTALHRSTQHDAPVEIDPLPLDLAGEAIRVGITVKPASDLAPGYALVLLHPLDAASAPSDALVVVDAPKDVDPLARHLDRELERLKLHLRDTVEQYEASTEDLKASNEELQAINEELRSATEELETSREELQSINEELTTVNHELKSKVDELAQSNSDMHNLMDATAIATVFLDRDLHITRYTPSAVELFSLIPTDVGRPLSDLASHLSYPEISADALRVLERLVPIEREVTDASGNSFLVRVLPYRTLDDRIAGVVQTFVDITERKRGEEALRLSEERFSSVVGQAAAGVLRCNLDGMVEFANRYFAKMLGRTEAELTGQPLYALFHPEDSGAISRLFADPTGVAGPTQMEARGLRADGSIVWLHNSFSFMSDVQGRSFSALVVSTDISARLLDEEALRVSEERLRLVIENATEYAIFTLDRLGYVTGWNAGAERLLGYSDDEIVGRSFDILFTEEDRAAGVPQQEVAQAGHLGRAGDDRFHVRKDGTRFWASGALMPMRTSAGFVGYVKILRDQSEMRRAQQALEANQLALEEADVAKDRFIAVLSHELRNPLASINSASQILRADILAQEEREQAAQIVQRQAAVMKLLLDDLLDVTRLRLGRLALNRRLMPLAGIVDAALEATRPLISGGHHHLTVNPVPRSVMLLADGARISQVLSNLLSNAAKYTPPGGRIELSTEVLENEVAIAVADNGIGMQSSSVESMFVMYSQSADAQHSQGLGIGLALARSLVQMHEGRIVGYSDGPGLGSRFTVYLPIAPPAEIERSASPAPLGTTTELNGLRVLVVDDNADAVWSTARVIEMWGCQVGTASNGAEAMAQASDLRPDAMIIDIGLPDFDGFEVMRRVRAEPWGADALLIAATGWGLGTYQGDAAEVHFDHHLVKPIDLDQLQQTLLQHFAGRIDPAGS